MKNTTGIVLTPEARKELEMDSSERNKAMYYSIKMSLAGRMYISHSEGDCLEGDTFHIKIYKSSTWRRIGLPGQLA